MRQQPPESGASVQQPQSPPTVQTRVDVRSQLLTFSKDMGIEQLEQWLRNHPSLTGANYEEDISKLIGIHSIYYVLIVLVVLYHNHDIPFRCQN